MWPESEIIWWIDESGIDFNTLELMQLIQRSFQKSNV